MIQCTVGLMAHNEEKNIAQALNALLNQRLTTIAISEIIVVASGCTDRTVDIAENFAQQNPLITVEVQKERAGKAAAINRLIQLAKEEVIVLAGADTLPDALALDYLVRPFADSTVGMTGARIVPFNDPREFLGLTIHILWRVHHRMALRWPKLGELVAFRKVIDAIPSNTSTDEVALEALISAKGYRLVYEPDAVVYNRGPQTISDFILQRRRIFAGHLHIASTLGYVTASLHPGHLLLLALEAFVFYSFLLPLMTGIVGMEMWARFLGTLDFMLKTSHHIWRPIRSTKQVSPTHQPLTVLILHCQPESVNPVTLVRNMHRIPTAEGVIFWWSQKRNHVLFMVPVSDLAGEELERRVRVLGQYVNPPGTAPGSTVVGYDVVQFARVTATQFQQTFP